MPAQDHEIVAAVAAFGALRFFPSEPGARQAVMQILEKMVATSEQLAWLVGAMINVGEWQGPGELRGVFCSKFRPADGVEKDATIAGFTTADGEMASLAAHERLKLPRGAAPTADKPLALLIGDVATASTMPASPARPARPDKASERNRARLADMEKGYGTRS